MKPAPLFEVGLQTSEGECWISYTSIDECLTDEGLRALFTEGHALSCALRQHGKRIASLPAALVSWERLRDQVISNATTLLRAAKETNK